MAKVVWRTSRGRCDSALWGVYFVVEVKQSVGRVCLSERQLSNDTRWIRYETVFNVRSNADIGQLKLSQKTFKNGERKNKLKSKKQLLTFGAWFVLTTHREISIPINFKTRFLWPTRVYTLR